MKKIRLFITVLLLLSVSMSVAGIGVCAETTTSTDTSVQTSENGVIIETVNLVYANKHMRGPGYFWDNINDTLTITNMTIDTDLNYGLRIPADATLVLEGNSTIRASLCALSLEGNLTVKGNGTLTLYSDGYGINASATDMNKKLTFKEGTVTINSAGDGIYSENAIITQNDKAKLSINVSNPDSYAINARQIKLLGGSFESNCSLYSRDIKISGINADIKSTRSAFIIHGASEDAPYDKVKLTNVKIKVGEDAGSLADAGAYAGEKCVSLKEHIPYTKSSGFLQIITGQSIPGTGFVDFVLIGLGVLLVGAFIAFPYIKHRRSLEKIEKAKSAAREEERLNKKADVNK